MKRFLPAFILHNTSNSPKQIVSSFKEALQMVHKGTKGQEDIQKSVNKSFEALKGELLGTVEHPPIPETVAFIVREVVRSHALPLLMGNLVKFDFERRKDAVQIFNNLMRRQFSSPREKDARPPVTDYLCKHPSLVLDLIKGYDNPEIASHCGQMIRECCESENLTKVFLYDESFYDFFHYVQNPAFDIAVDAFMTLKALLTKHHELALEFAEKNYDRLFGEFASLVNSKNFFVKTQSLKLLCIFLLNRVNHALVEKFVSVTDHLVMVMECLREDSDSIRFEAFHVFKIFVLYPKKTQQVHEILYRNKSKLLRFFEQKGLRRGAAELDESSEVDRLAVVRAIEELPPFDETPIEGQLEAYECKSHVANAGNGKGTRLKV